MVKAYFIQYKFILPESTKHSSYAYQKLFRALYGYTQKVTKSNGKEYSYYRDGILSNIPFIRTGKNCILISPQNFQFLISYFKTGKNPAHAWKEKGDWKAVYYMSEKEMSISDVVKSIDSLIDRSYISPSHHDEQNLLVNEIKKNSEKALKDPVYKSIITNKVNQIVSHEWFKTALDQSAKAKEVYSLYQQLK